MARTPTLPDPGWYTVHQASLVTDVPRRTLTAWIAKGWITGAKSPGVRGAAILLSFLGLEEAVFLSLFPMAAQGKARLEFLEFLRGSLFGEMYDPPIYAAFVGGEWRWNPQPPADALYIDVHTKIAVLKARANIIAPIGK